jgi:hypothetical protein
MDPRPAYYASTPQKSHFGMKVYDVDVLWKIIGDIAYVTACKDVSESRTP